MGPPHGRCRRAWRGDSLPAGGIRAGLLAGGLFVLPGALLVTALAWLHALGEKVPLVAAAFEGTRPAVVALVALAAWRIGSRSITTGITAALALGALAALAAGAPFPLAMLVAGLVGVVAPMPLALPSGRSSPHPVGAVAAGPAPAGSPPTGIAPPSTRTGSLRHPVVVLAVALALWLGSYAVVAFVPDGRVDPIALLVAIAAAAALVPGRLPAPLVVALAAGVGIVRMLLG